MPAADRDHRLVAGDDRLHQRLAVAAPRAAERKRRRYDDATRMHRALAEAIVELDAVGGGAAEEGGIDEVGAPRAAGHRNTAGRPCRREHRFGAARDVAACAGDHDAHGVEQVAARVVARLIGNGGVAELRDEFDERRGHGRNGMERLQRFGVGHDVLPRARASLCVCREFHQSIDGDDALSSRAHDQRIDFRFHDTGIAGERR